jgi:hypothetical protein
MNKDYLVNSRENKYRQTGINYQKIIPVRKPDSYKSNSGLERKSKEKF